MSNLTNLLVFSASGLSFARFAEVMVLPWVTVIAVEYVVLRVVFATDLAAPSHIGASAPQQRPPVFAVIVLAATLAGFIIAEPLGVRPAWVATAAALAMAAPRIGRQPRSEATGILRAANLPFCSFVFALGVIVLAVRSSTVGVLIGRLVPDRAGFVGLLAGATMAAVLANLLNNLPATLMLLPLVAHSSGLILAVLIGVNVGPNLTYVGSLATLLWRQVLRARDHPLATVEFLRLGAFTVPAGLLAGVAALWVSLRISGIS